MGAEDMQLDDFARLRSDIYLRHSADDPEGYLRLARALTGQQEQLDPVMAGMARLHALAKGGSGDLDFLPEPGSGLGQEKEVLPGKCPYIDRYLADVLRKWATSGISEQREQALRFFKALAGLESWELQETPGGQNSGQDSGQADVLAWQNNARADKGGILVQPVFYGDPGRPGQGGGGGLATLLRDLGSVLPSKGLSVLTVALQQDHRRRPAQETIKAPAPEQLLAPGHLLTRLPIHLESADPAGFLQASHRIARAMDTILQPLAGSRTVVHLRYLDDASRAAGLAAKRLGLTLAMTLAPDPHRNICSPDGKILPRKPEAARELFNRILIGDELLSWSQGVVAIGRNAFAGELAAWFPQLEDTRGRILKGIDEGVDTSPARTDLDASAILCNPRLVLGLAEDRLARASLVCVGRLNPVKGQATLAQVWANNGLWQDFNLVFIGGNLDEPSTEERLIRDAIRSVLRPELQGRLCHLPAQSNDVVRGLLSWFALRRPSGGCDFYVCPSLKEEFGLSILEAMAAGMPVCAPLNGGARTYIRHGNNGYLVDTSTALSLARELQVILGSREGLETPRWNSPGIMRIKQRARQTVEEEYSLSAMANEYADFYRRMANRML